MSDSNDDKNSGFTPLRSRERESKIRAFIQAKESIRIWRKGDKEALGFAIESGEGDLLNVELLNLAKKSFVEGSFLNTKLLFTIDMKGLKFFGTGKLNRKSDLFQFTVDEKLFKSERRKDFRILAFPVHDIKVEIPVVRNNDADNVVEFTSAKKKGEHTHLFSQFLSLVDNKSTTTQENLESNQDGEFVTLRALDVSISGLSLRISEYEKAFFEETKKLGAFYLCFEQTKYIIPASEIVYVMDYVDHDRKGLNFYKVGIRFQDVSELLYQDLSRELNKRLQQVMVDKEFEDFIK